jgi:hypothetical protein
MLCMLWTVCGHEVRCANCQVLGKFSLVMQYVFMPLWSIFVLCCLYLCW